MQPEAARIAARWHELAAVALRADGKALEHELQWLLAAYSGAGRHYHDLRHIAALLGLSARHCAALVDHVTVDLAIVYHDVVYDPARTDNEEASAVIAAEHLTALGLDAPRVATVARYIRATQHLAGASAGKPPDTDLDHLLDFDLSILAAEPAEYDAYAAAIRREYAIYADDAYARGRARVLRTLLGTTLYRVPALAAQWEPRARANLARELSTIEPISGGPSRA